MSKIAIILHAEPGTHDALGRALHALLYAKELHEAGHPVQLLFDGGGTLWIQEFKNPDNQLASLYDGLKSHGIITGVCDFCIDAYEGDREFVEQEGLALASEYNGHPSVAKLVSDGYQIVTL